MASHQQAAALLATARAFLSLERSSQARLQAFKTSREIQDSGLTEIWQHLFVQESIYRSARHLCNIPNFAEKQGHVLNDPHTPCSLLHSMYTYTAQD